MPAQSVSVSAVSWPRDDEAPFGASAAGDGPAALRVSFADDAAHVGSFVGSDDGDLPGAAASPQRLRRLVASLSAALDESEAKRTALARELDGRQEQVQWEKKLPFFFWSRPSANFCYSLLKNNPTACRRGRCAGTRRGRGPPHRQDGRPWGGSGMVKKKLFKKRKMKMNKKTLEKVKD
jgi:hypothetical protein